MLNPKQSLRLSMYGLAWGLCWLCATATEPSDIVNTWRKSNGKAIPGRYTLVFKTTFPFSQEEADEAVKQHVASYTKQCQEMKAKGLEIAETPSDYESRIRSDFREDVKQGEHTEFSTLTTVFLDENNFLATCTKNIPQGSIRTDLVPIKLERRGGIIALWEPTGLNDVAIYDFSETPERDVSLSVGYAYDLGQMMTHLSDWMTNYPKGYSELPWEAATLETEKTPARESLLNLKFPIFKGLAITCGCDSRFGFIPTEMNISDSKEGSLQVITANSVEQIVSQVWKPKKIKTKQYFTQSGKTSIGSSTELFFKNIDCASRIEDTDLQLDLAGINRIIDKRYGDNSYKVFNVKDLDINAIRASFFRPLSDDEKAKVKKDKSIPREGVQNVTISGRNWFLWITGGGGFLAFLTWIVLVKSKSR